MHLTLIIISNILTGLGGISFQYINFGVIQYEQHLAVLVLLLIFVLVSLIHRVDKVVWDMNRATVTSRRKAQEEEAFPLQALLYPLESP